MSGRFGELLVILLIVFVIFGAGKLPKVMSELGKGIRSLRKGMNGKSEDKSDDENSEKI